MVIPKSHDKSKQRYMLMTKAVVESYFGKIKPSNRIVATE